MKISRIAIAVTLLLLATAATLFLFFFERYSEEIDRGFGDEARRNRFLAAEQFLTDVGVPHRRADNIAVLGELGEGDALFLTSSSQIYNVERLQQFLQWIEQGGEAIVVASGGNADHERDQLLDYLGLSVTRGEIDLYFNQQVREVFGEQAADIRDKTLSELMREHNRRVDGEESSAEEAEIAPEEEYSEENQRDPDIDDERLLFFTSDSGAGYTLFFNPQQVLTHELMAEEHATEVDGGYLRWVRFANIPDQSPMVQFERGRGRITLLADSGLWQNDRIGEFDHAYFLSHLIGERALVMITRPHFDGLTTLARRYASEFFLAGFLALLAWIANRSRRFGPLTPPPSTERRSLLEHIRACGHFYWRTDRAQALYESARRPLLQKISGRPAEAARALPRERQQAFAETIAARSGLTSSEVFTTLWESAPHSEHDFTARMRSIQIIEAAL
ncbi:DUF4350 domain-containing protein [Microbulbifer aggregans]|uniref:DUF4350 domain-containing protein n=1 Tax=Microbulbifer aggregans TaxID=1769779 RepID=UPI001CFD4D51|nr:DUF4350 domain-containing protein [Microbulbifer aggregans]